MDLRTNEEDGRQRRKGRMKKRTERSTWLNYPCAYLFCENVLSTIISCNLTSSHDHSGVETRNPHPRAEATSERGI